MRPLTPYNQELFDIYLGKVLSGYVKNQEPSIARRLKNTLETVRIEPISSWEDIYNLSSKYKIYYNNSKGLNHGCPFHRLRQELAKEHGLPERKYQPVGAIEKYIEQFEPQDKKIIEAYIQSKKKTHKLKTSTVRHLRCINQFYKWNGRSSLCESSNQVGPYLRSIDSLSVGHYADYHQSLRSFFKWLFDNQYIGSNPFDSLSPKTVKKKCSSCHDVKSFKTNSNTCERCLLIKKNGQVVERVSKSYQIKFSYNQELWSLYAKYLDRFIIKNHHQKVSLGYRHYLSMHTVPTIKNWQDVKDLSIKFEDFMDGLFKGGCPFGKTAFMLVELGVLPTREEDHSVSYHNHLKSLDDDFLPVARKYFQTLLKSKRTIYTCANYCRIFRDLQTWLEDHHGLSNVLNFTEAMAKEYLIQNKPSHEMLSVLKKFYSWAKRHRYIFSNPFDQFELRSANRALLICSNDQIKKIIKYIKSNESDPERAFILALIFYWGLNNRELRYSTIEIEDGQVIVHLYRPNLSWGYKSYNRHQVLKISKSPRWLWLLQNRFISQWQIKYQKVEKSFPQKLLLFTKNLKSSRPIGSEVFLIRVHKATLEATGEKIPPSVIRRTSGHIYSLRGEASILTYLGWSRDYASDFVWRQRRLFKDTRKLKIELKVKKLK